jgi:hypothetical protein
MDANRKHAPFTYVPFRGGKRPPTPILDPAILGSNPGFPAGLEVQEEAHFPQRAARNFFWRNILKTAFSKARFTVC